MEKSSFIRHVQEINKKISNINREINYLINMRIKGKYADERRLKKLKSRKSKLEKEYLELLGFY
ncbi:MAG: hypothetical protein ACOCP8_04355 [archaeon]